jgi:hypothetical protein
MRRAATYTPPTLKPRSRFLPVLASIAVLPALAALQGCLVASGKTVRETGPQISESTLLAIDYRKTPTEWLIASFGEPANRVCLPDGAEILRYDCDVRTTEGSYFLMLAASSTNRIERTCWWFETRDGTIVRAWGEKCDPITVDSLNPPPPNDAAIGIDAPRTSPAGTSVDAPAGGTAPTRTDAPNSAQTSRDSAAPETAVTPSGR